MVITIGLIFRIFMTRNKMECRSQQNISLDEAELTAAMKLLDKRGSGYIEFDEFVDWWVNQVCTPLLLGPYLVNSDCPASC